MGWLIVSFQTSDIVIIQELTDVQIKFVFVSHLVVNVAFCSFVSVMVWPILYTLLLCAYSFLLLYNYIIFFCIYIFVCIRFYNCFRMFSYICMSLMINLYNWHFNIYNDWTHEINKKLVYKQNINFSIHYTSIWWLIFRPMISLYRNMLLWCCFYLLETSNSQ